MPLEVFSDNPYKTLISTILSSRTKDEVTLEACLRLFEVAPTLSKLKKIDPKLIKKLIYPVGFYTTKSVYLYKIARMIKRVPSKYKELIKLPGVGRKTANLVLNRAFNIPSISVDTHVHRICNFINLVNTKRPEQTEKELNKIIPKKYWKDLNRLFVSIGRQYKTNKKLKTFLENEGII